MLYGAWPPRAPGPDGPAPALWGWGGASWPARLAPSPCRDWPFPRQALPPFPAPAGRCPPPVVLGSPAGVGVGPCGGAASLR